MRLTDIAINDLRRRKSRMSFLVLGLVMGVATVVSLVSITQTMNADIQDKIDQYGANIVVTPKSDDLSLSYGGISVSSTPFDVKELHSRDAALIRTIELKANIAAVAPKLVGGVDVAGTRALLVGVDLAEELKVKQWWHVVGETPAEPDEVLLGYAAAARFGLMPGSRLDLGGRQFLVSGTLKETGGPEDSLIIADLATVQEVLGKPGAVSLIEVSALCKACPVEDIVAQIGGVLPDARITALAQAVKSRQQTVDQLTSFSAAVAFVVMVIGAMIVLTTMMSSVSERTREIGIFRAIGFRRGHIARIILSEAAVLSAAGGVIGWLAGTSASIILAPRLAQIDLPVSWDPTLAAGAIGLSLAVGLLASAYPAARASNLDPAEALRFI